MADYIPLCALTGAAIPIDAPLWWMVIKPYPRRIFARSLLQPGVSLGGYEAFTPSPGPIETDPLIAALQDPLGTLEVGRTPERAPAALDGCACAVIARETADACDKHFRVSEMAEAHLDTIRRAIADGQMLVPILPDYMEDSPYRIPENLWNIFLPSINYTTPYKEVRAALRHDDPEVRKVLWRTLAVLYAAVFVDVPHGFPFLGGYLNRPDDYDKPHREREGVMRMLSGARKRASSR